MQVAPVKIRTAATKYLERRNYKIVDDFGAWVVAKDDDLGDLAFIYVQASTSGLPEEKPSAAGFEKVMQDWIVANPAEFVDHPIRFDIMSMRVFEDAGTALIRHHIDIGRQLIP